MAGVLNLQKNDILDLRKAEPGLKHVMLGAGWDVAKKGFFNLGADYDLDLIALLLDSNDKLINRLKEDTDQEIKKYWLQSRCKVNI